MSDEHYSSIIDMMYFRGTIVYAIIVICCSYVVIPFLIFKLNQKKKSIRKPENNESYCVISIYICNLAIFSLSW